MATDRLTVIDRVAERRNIIMGALASDGDAPDEVYLHVLVSDIDALLAAAREAEGLRAELASIDERLSRRPALADCDSRADKVERACYVAGRAESAETALAAANERAEWAEEELSKAKQYGAPVSGAVRRSSLPSKTCEHNDYWTTNYGHCMACRAEQAEAKHRITLDLWEQAEAENKRLRRMLAIVYAGSALYGDDGELHDGRGRPHIDFKRDDATDIEAKMRERANAALRPADAGEGVG